MTTTETDLAVLKERMDGIRRDLDRMESSTRWLWRTVITAVIGSAVALFFTGVQGAFLGG